MIIIRQLEKTDDYDDLIILSREFFREYEAHHKDFFKIDHLHDQDIYQYFLSFCGVETRKAFIAVDGDRIVGYITAYVKNQADYWHCKQIGEISGLMVADVFRKRGVAKRLLDEAVQFFSLQGLVYYTVYTAVANQAGLDFYHKNGLVPLYTTLLGVTQAARPSKIHGQDR
ncbi:MAG TPA: GNAT family N-acetyltransferase [Anaerolineales bacterium]|nr:GNAT family N-acetyltransferase [Anaerolineales bacterium]